MRRTARSRSFLVALMTRPATARSTNSEPARTSDQRSARVSPGRRPAYANVETNTASRKRSAASNSTRILSTQEGARAPTNRLRRGFGFRTSRTGFASISPRRTANRQAPETIASAFATVASPTPASPRYCRNASTRPGVSDRILTAQALARCVASRRLSFLLAIPSFGIPLIRKRLRMVTAVGAPSHHVLARSLVPPDARAARSIARSLSDDPTWPLASGSERPEDGAGRRPASIHARKSSGHTTHRLRTFDPTSSPALKRAKNRFCREARPACDLGSRHQVRTTHTVTISRAGSVAISRLDSLSST